MSGSSGNEGPDLSVVIPAYNEALRFEESLRAISDHLESLACSAEIIVVDDGSEDGTFERLQSVASQLRIPVRAFRYRTNRGKGYALKVGFEHARGDRILFSDADLATPIEQLGDLSRALDSGSDIAIGSRRKAGADVRVHQPWVRERMGMVFTWLVGSFIADVSDVTCGFKMFRGDVGRLLFAHLRIDAWAFDAELLMLAERRGHRIAEVPVRWEDQPGTKVRLIRDAWSSARGLLTILLNDRRGLYAATNATDAVLEIWPPSESDPARQRRPHGDS